jgi:hypothetical protein
MKNDESYAFASDLLLSLLARFSPSRQIILPQFV